MADPFDALFKQPAPQVRAPAEKRVARVVDGVCSECGKSGVFWTMPPGPFYLCEFQNGRAVHHNCVSLDDFEELE